MDAPGGLEPPLTESESAVLPLDDGAMVGSARLIGGGWAVCQGLLENSVSIAGLAGKGNASLRERSLRLEPPLEKVLKL